MAATRIRELIKEINQRVNDVTMMKLPEPTERRILIELAEAKHHLTRARTFILNWEYEREQDARSS